MARMTKTQIDHLKEKLSRKIHELALKNEKKTGAKTLNAVALAEAMNRKEFIVWLKTQPKAVIIQAMSDSGIAYDLHIYPHDCLDQMKQKLDHAASVNPVIKRFAISQGLWLKIGARQAFHVSAEKFVAVLRREAEEVVDAAVFAETPADVQRAIAKFMAKK